jgi:hypothetical protein
MPSRERVVDLPPLDLRAAITMRAPTSADSSSRTIDLTWSTGAGVIRRDWFTGERYLERLSLNPKHVRLDRLNGGAPLLNSHGSYSLEDQIGIVEDGSASVDGKRGTAAVRFSSRASVDPIWHDVATGIIRNVSVGYAVHTYVETAGDDTGRIPTRTAVDWEPYEISLVPMPADAGAQTRATAATVSCRIVTRAKDTAMPDPTIDPNTFDPNLFDRTPPPAPPADPPAPTDVELAATHERERVQGIMAACRIGRIPTADQDDLIARGVPLVEAQSRVFEIMRTRANESGGPQINVRITGDDPSVAVRAGIEDAILHRINPVAFPLSDAGRPYRGLALIDIAKSYLHAQNIRTASLSRLEIAATALGLSTRVGYHTTSDFAVLLENVLNKNLRTAFNEQPQTYSVISRQITAADFKPISMVQFGGAPSLAVVNEHGEYTRGTIGTAKETFAIKKYGRVFAITREAIVNDDVSAFARVPQAFGRSARQLESDLVWAEITKNANMADGQPLFSAAHKNLGNPGMVLSIDSLSRARTAIRLQTDLDNLTRLGLTPKYLIVPPSQETLAQQLVGVVAPAIASNVNPFSGVLQVVSEPRLEDNNPKTWYLACDPTQVDMILYAYLEGQTGPVIEQRVGFDIDGLEVKCRHEFGAKAVDWRGMFKDPGV